MPIRDQNFQQQLQTALPLRSSWLSSHIWPFTLVQRQTRRAGVWSLKRRSLRRRPLLRARALAKMVCQLVTQPLPLSPSTHALLPRCTCCSGSREYWSCSMIQMDSKYDLVHTAVQPINIICLLQGVVTHAVFMELAPISPIHVVTNEHEERLRDLHSRDHVAVSNVLMFPSNCLAE